MTTVSRLGNIAEDVAIKAPVRVATTANITLSGLLTIDGVVLAEGNRVLVKDQTDATENGIYAASSGNWTRTVDARKNTDFIDGTLVFVVAGATNTGLLYAQTCADDPVVFGTSLVSFTLQSDVATQRISAASSTSLAIGTGPNTFAIPAGKALSASQWVLCYSRSNPANCILAQIDSYSGTSLAVIGTATGGSGTISDWQIVLTNSAAAAGLMPPVGSGNVTGPGSAAASHLAIFTDASGKVLGDGGVAGALANVNSVTAKYLAASAIAFGVSMLNGTLVESHAAGALTIAVKTLAGADPSAEDPVYFIVRDATAGAGNYAIRPVTAPLSLTISSGSMLGFDNATAGRLWIAAFDDGGVIRLAVINCLSGSNIYSLGGFAIASTSADDNAGGSDLPQVFYTAIGHAMVSMPYVVLGYMTWENGLTSAGTWDAAPTRIQLAGPGVPLPGTHVQTKAQDFPLFATGSGNVTFDNSIPQNNEGDQYMSLDITPTSGANLLSIEAQMMLVNSGAGNMCMSLFQDATPNALKSAAFITNAANVFTFMIPLKHRMKAMTAIVTTFKARAGAATAGSTYFNGYAGGQLFGGVSDSFIAATEIMG